MPCTSCGCAYRRRLVVEKEAALVALDDVEGVGVVVGRRERAQAGLRQRRFAVRPASRWMVAIVAVGVERRGWEGKGEVARDVAPRSDWCRPLLRGQWRRVGGGKQWVAVWSSLKLKVETSQSGLGGYQPLLVRDIPALDYTSSFCMTSTCYACSSLSRACCLEYLGNSTIFKKQLGSL